MARHSNIPPAQRTELVLAVLRGTERLEVLARRLAAWDLAHDLAMRQVTSTLPNTDSRWIMPLVAFARHGTPLVY